MRTSHASGFTLIELLVVIAIIGLLATLAVVGFSNAQAKARDAKRLANKRQLISAIQLFYDQNGRVPISASSGGAWACVGAATDSCWLGSLSGLGSLVTDLSPYINIVTLKNKARTGTNGYDNMLYISNCSAGGCGAQAGTYINWMQELGMNTTICPAPNLITYISPYWYCNELISNLMQ